MNEDLDLIRVVDVEYLHDYTMLLEFSNGEKRIVDFAPDYLFRNGVAA